MAACVSTPCRHIWRRGLGLGENLSVGGIAKRAAGLMAAFWIGVALSALPLASEEKTSSIAPEKPKFTQTGLASFYSAGGKTASGRKHSPGEFYGAHRSLAFGSRVRVTHLASGKEVVVTITDRGPFRRGRIIDISREAAKALGITKLGVAKVQIALVD